MKYKKNFQSNLTRAKKSMKSKRRRNRKINLDPTQNSMGSNASSNASSHRSNASKFNVKTVSCHVRSCHVISCHAMPCSPSQTGQPHNWTASRHASFPDLTTFKFQRNSSETSIV